MQNDSVVFVQSAKDPKRITWTLPQGGMRQYESIDEAVEREVREELGFTPSVSSMKMLGQYVNVLPKERQEKKPKLMICVGIYGNAQYFRLNGENSKVVLVRNTGHLWELLGDMSNRRPSKVACMCHSLLAAHRRSMISWSCQSFLDHMENHQAA